MIVARDIMTPHVKSVPQTWTMQRFARFLTDNEITGSPVVDDEGNVVGIATLKDIAEFNWNQAGENEQRLTDEEREEARRIRQFIFAEMAKIPVEVRDIMTPIVTSVREDTTIREIADIMMQEHLHRVFVRGLEPGSVVGIITTYDMLKVIANPSLTLRCLEGH